MGFESLSDFEVVAQGLPSLEERKSFIQDPHFFNSPQALFTDKQKHSALVDKILDYHIDQIELGLLKKAKKLAPEGDMKTWGRLLHNGSQSWVGLTPQQLQTTYNELWQMCDLLKPKGESTFVDLGAGYGRLALILQLFAPQVHFLGYEIVKERVEEGNRMFELLGLKHASLLEQDLSAQDFIIPDADYYFMYDFGDSEHIRRILTQLEFVADRQPIRVVVRGDYSRHQVQNFYPWLSQVFKAYHEEKFSIYSSASF